jgi:hypothetical protein
VTTLDLAAENAVAEFFPWLGEAVLLAAVPADIGDGGCTSKGRDNRNGETKSSQPSLDADRGRGFVTCTNPKSRLFCRAM